MKLLKLDIQNFRMFEHTIIKFNPKKNFIIGKNNIGKTSTLYLLKTILSGENFSDSDFLNNKNPIVVTTTLKLKDSEVGLFYDNFSEKGKNQIDIKFSQDDPDSSMIITSVTSTDTINRKQIKYSNYIGFSSNIKPVRENDLTQISGKYKIIPYLIKSFLNFDNLDANKKNDTEKNVIEYINNYLMKIKPFNKNKINIDFEQDSLDYLTRIIKIQDSSGIEFSKLGFGTQFSSLIPLIILDQIILWHRYNHLDEHLCRSSNNKKVLNIILGLDEPEVHLHPNLQLSVIKDIESLLMGKDSDFNQLLKDIFDIDCIQGQMIVVTHSPYVISNNYSEYIRYGLSNEGAIEVSSGSSFNLDTGQRKQLEMQLPQIKSSLFADKVIIVEGQTEEGAMPVFADRLNISLVEKNVNIIDSRGYKSIPAIQKLFSKFNIPTYPVVDNDGEDKHFDNVYVTVERDFEAECLKKIDLRSINKYLKEYAEYIKGSKYFGTFWNNFFDENFNTKRNENIRNNKVYEFIDEYINKNVNDSNTTLKNDIFKKLITKDKYFKDKSIVNGSLIANNLISVPETYSKVIKEATKEATNEKQ